MQRSLVLAGVAVGVLGCATAPGSRADADAVVDAGFDGRVLIDAGPMMCVVPAEGHCCCDADVAGPTPVCVGTSWSCGDNPRFRYFSGRECDYTWCGSPCGYSCDAGPSGPALDVCPDSPTAAYDGRQCTFSSACVTNYDFWPEPLPGEPDRVVCGERVLTCVDMHSHFEDHAYDCTSFRVDAGADASASDGGRAPRT